MDRETALQYVGHCVDDALSPRKMTDAPADFKYVKLIGWQCGFEPMFVAVWSYLPRVMLEDGEAEEIASDYLHEIGYFGSPAEYSVPEADYVL